MLFHKNYCTNVFFYGIMNGGILLKTLYITDLDGTLLQPDASISETSRRILTELLEREVLFTVATARSIASAQHILKQLPLRLPVILMNGVCIHDLQSGALLHRETIPESVCFGLLELLKRFRLSGMLYRMGEEGFRTYYTSLTNDAIRSFVAERQAIYDKRFVQVSSLEEQVRDDVIYLTLLDSYEALAPLYQLLESDPVQYPLHTAFYRDIYSDCWYLEIFGAGASKEHAVRWLRQQVQCDRTVCFGDSRNDLSLFAGGDISCAVANAVPEVQAAADLVIGANTEDAVPRWILQQEAK